MNRPEGSVPAGNVPGGSAEATHATDPLLAAALWLARHHGVQASAAAMAAGLPLESGKMELPLLPRALERAGLRAAWAARRPSEVSPAVLPALVPLREGGVLVLLARDGSAARCIVPETGGERVLPAEELDALSDGRVLLAHPQARLDDRASDWLPALGTHWLRETLLRFTAQYRDVAIAAVVINLIALGTPLFVMNVYDRVVPTGAEVTLWTLSLGLAIALLFEFVLRMIRSHLVDDVGKRVDLLLSSQLFARVIGVRLENRPASVGVTAGQMREFEAVRDFFTSATLVALIDLPFLLLFVVVVAALAGALALVPLTGAVLVILCGLALQRPMSGVIRENLRESAQRSALAVEAIGALETIKANNAEGKFQGRWERIVSLTAESSLRSRWLSALGVNLGLLIQQLGYVALILGGVFLIFAGELTMGGLIACSILSGRIQAPLGQLANLLTRWQNARLATESLDRLMALPQERAADAVLHVADLGNDLELKDVVFAYPGAPAKSLQAINLRIAAGEKVAILGRIGSGKSTLLKVMAGLLRPESGSVRLGGVDIAQLDPAVVRGRMGFVEQEARLFFGTLRENLALRRPDSGDDEILAASRFAGVDAFAQSHPAGYGLPIGEGGLGLSGGQRQAVALARALVGNPPLLVFDEPTSGMDGNTEQRIVDNLRQLGPDRTLIVVTHKPTLLPLVTRVVIVEQGRIVADGPRDEVLRQLAGGRPVAAAVASAAGKGPAGTDTASEGGRAP